VEEHSLSRSSLSAPSAAPVANRLLYQRQEPLPWFSSPLLLVPPLRAKVRGMDRLDAWTSSSPLSPTDAPENAVQAGRRCPREEAPDEGLVPWRVHTREDDSPGKPSPPRRLRQKCLTRAVTVLTYLGIASSPSRSDSGKARTARVFETRDRPRSKTTCPDTRCGPSMVV